MYNVHTKYCVNGRIPSTEPAHLRPGGLLWEACDGWLPRLPRAEAWGGGRARTSPHSTPVRPPAQVPRCLMVFVAGSAGSLSPCRRGGGRRTSTEHIDWQCRKIRYTPEKSLVHRPQSHPTSDTYCSRSPVRFGSEWIASGFWLLACGEEWVQEVVPWNLILDPWRSDQMGAHWPIARKTAWIGKRRILGVWRTGADVGEGWQDGASGLSGFCSCSCSWSLLLLLFGSCCLLVLALLTSQGSRRHGRCYRPPVTASHPSMPESEPRNSKWYGHYDIGSRWVCMWQATSVWTRRIESPGEQGFPRFHPGGQDFLVGRASGR